MIKHFADLLFLKVTPSKLIMLHSNRQNWLNYENVNYNQTPLFTTKFKTTETLIKNIFNIVTIQSSPKDYGLYQT